MLTPFGSNVERTYVVLGCEVDVGILGEEQLGYSLVAVVGRYVKRREPRLGCDVRIVIILQ